MHKYHKCNLCVVCEVNGGYCGCFSVQMYDSEGNLISECFTKANQCVYFSVATEGVYQVKAKLKNSDHIGEICPLEACIDIFLTPCTYCSQYIVFHKLNPPLNIVKVDFRFTDAKYQNLPIEGVLSLWRHTM